MTEAAAESGSGTLRRIVQTILRFDRSTIEIGFGTRSAAGVAIPLVLGLLAGNAAYGVSAAVGALSAGFASMQGVYRTRAAAMLITSGGMAFSALVAGLAGHTALAMVAVTVLWGFAYGMLASLGPMATTAGLNSVVALVIYSEFNLDPGAALAQAGLVFAGGAFQTLLLVLVWPLRRLSAERYALARAFRSLAAYAHDVSVETWAAPDPQHLRTVRQTLLDPQPFARRGEITAFQSLLDEAERIRTGLAVLVRDRQRLCALGLNVAGQHALALINAASLILEELGSALEEARAPVEPDEYRRVLDRALAGFDTPAAPVAEVAGAAAAIEQTVTDARALLGRLRSAVRIAQIPAAAARSPSLRHFGARLLVLPQVSDGIETLLANFQPKSVYFRHAVRLAIALGVAMLADRVLPLQRGYWVPMTAALVLRPDFATTYVRGVSRLTGTVAGAVLATLIAALLRPGPELLVALCVVFAWLGYIVIRANYAVYTVTVTAYVVFLLALMGLPEKMGVLDRVEATLLGGVLALVAYAVWPSWESRRVRGQLADLLDAQRRYAALVLQVYIDSRQHDAAAIRQTQLTAWGLRSNAEASFDSMMSEPSRTNEIEPGLALGLLAASKRFGFASLTLQAHALDAADVARPSLSDFATQLDRALTLVVDALRERRAPAPLPPLRATQHRLMEDAGHDPQADLSTLAAETDLQVDSVNTMAELLAKDAAAL
ncbi:hypothetical protein EPN52_10650 [bacterium]|nr:MAG: hypothetical protein EPN52_10650 [bacterium]